MEPFLTHVEFATTGVTASVPPHLRPRGQVWHASVLGLRMYCVARQAWHCCRSGDPVTSVDLSAYPAGHPCSSYCPEPLSSLQSPTIPTPPGQDNDEALRSPHDLSMHLAPTGHTAHVDDVLVTTA